MERDAFPVSVSLARYFSDERARCLMSCCPRRRVGWLARRLRRTFALPARPALTCRGHLLPPGEPLTLLQPEDTIEAIPPTVRVADLSRERASSAGEVARGPKRRRYESPEPSQLPGLSEPPSASEPPSPSEPISPSEPVSLPSPSEPISPPSRSEPISPPSPTEPSSLPSPPLASPARTSPPPCLEEMKRRALELLEIHEAPAPRRRRRRVRRRRTAAPDAALRPKEEVVEPEAMSVAEVELEVEARMEAAAELEEGMEAAAKVGVEVKAETQVTVEVETEVLRNGDGRRAARCVRALDNAHH